RRARFVRSCRRTPGPPFVRSTAPSVTPNVCSSPALVAYRRASMRWSKRAFGAASALSCDAFLPFAEACMRNGRGTFALHVVAPLAAAATAACPSPSDKTKTQTGATGAVNVSSFDDFNKDLAKRVTEVLVPGGAADFQVVVTPAMDPIGTLYRKGRSVPY